MFSRRSFLWYVCFALAIGACYFAYQAIDYRQRVESWKQAIPAEFKIDLSIAGDHSGPLHQITQRPCKEIIGVRIESDKPVTRDLLEGLRGTITIVSDKQEEVVTYPLHFHHFNEWLTLPEKTLELFYSWPWSPGHYTLRIHVDKPAPALKNIPQTVIVRYELCGIEGMPVVVYYVFAGLCGVPALITFYCLFVTRKPKPTTDVVDSQA